MGNLVPNTPAMYVSGIVKKVEQVVEIQTGVNALKSPYAFPKTARKSECTQTLLRAS